MQTSFNPVWKSLQLSIRLSIVFAARFSQNPSLFFAFRAVSLLQTLLGIIANTNHKTFDRFFGSIFNPLQDFWQYSELDLYPSSALTLLIILVVYFIIRMIIVISVFCSLSNENIRTWSSLKLLTGLLNFHTEVLYYPINLALVRLYSQLIEDQDISLKLQEDLTLAIIFTLICLNTLVEFYHITLCYSRVKSDKFMDRKGSIHLLAIAIFKLLLPFLKYPVIFGFDQSYEVISIIIFLIICLGLQFYTETVLPEYNIKILKMHTIFHSVAICITISQLTEIIFGEKGLSLILTLLISPFWTKFSLNRIKTLLDFIRCNPDKLSNLNHAAHLEVIYDDIADDFEAERFKTKFSLKFLQATEAMAHLEFGDSQTNQITDFKKTNKDYLKLCFERIVKRKPKNVLISLIYAELILDHSLLYSKSYHFLEVAKLQRISTPDRISIFNVECKILEGLQKKVCENSASNISTRSLWQQLTAENAFQDFQSTIDDYMEHLTKFWQSFKHEKKNILTLIQKARSIEKKRLCIENKWKKHQNDFSRDFPLGYLLYGILKAQFMNLPWQGESYINKYYIFLQNKLSQKNSKNSDDNYDECGTIIISGAKEALGKILKLSGSIRHIFQRDRASLLGQSVNMLMPKFFQEIHNAMLINHYETGEARAIGTIRVYGKDADNNVFPILITVGIPPNLENGVVFIGLIKKVKDQSEYILFDENGLIEETSFGVGKLLKIKPYDNTSILNVCPDLDYKLNSLKLAGQQNEYSEDSNQEILKEKSRTFKFQQVGNKPVEISSKISITTCCYFNRVLNIMTLKLDERIHKKVLFEKSQTQDKLSMNNQKSDLISVLTESKVESPVRAKNLKKPNDHPLGSSISVVSKRKIIDKYQEILLRSASNNLKNTFIATFMLLILVSLMFTGVEYHLLEDSSQDISFALSSTKATYKRLTSLGWAWMYCVLYMTRVDKLAVTNDVELDRYKLLVRTNRQILKTANDELITVVEAGTKEQQKQFFTKEIKFIYDEITHNVESMLDSFEAINILVDKLTKFDITPHREIFQGSPELEFVRKNSMNDLLISSERIIGIVESLFAHAIDKNGNIMDYIFFGNIGLNCFGIFLIFLLFYTYLQRDIQVVQSLSTVNNYYIDFSIYKLTSFRTLLKEETTFLARKFQKLHLKYSDQILENKILKRNYHKIEGTPLIRLKESLILIVLIVCFSLIPLIGLISSNISLDEILKTKERTIIASRALNNCNLAFASMADILQARNTSTMRNQPNGLQALINVKNVFSNEIILDTFTEDDGKFIDPSIEALFRGKPCSLVVNYPGSNMLTNCPKATYNQTIGIFAVNSYYRDELYSFATDILGNLTFDNAKKMLPIVTANLAPKAITILGAYMFLIDVMSNLFSEQTNNLLDVGRIKLSIEIITMSSIGALIVYILMKIFNDPAIRLVLQLVPYVEISRNQSLRIVVKRFYNERLDLFLQDI